MRYRLCARFIFYQTIIIIGTMIVVVHTYILVLYFNFIKIYNALLLLL